MYSAKRILLACILIFPIARLASAADPVDVIAETSKGLTGSNHGITGVSSATKNLNNPGGDYIYINPNTQCEPGQECLSESFPDVVSPGAGRESNFNFYGSMTGFAAGVHSKKHVDATLNDYISGELALTYITLGLTEPAVASGIFQALNYVANDVNNRLQADQTFFSQMAVMPEVGEQIGQTYISCIARARRVEKVTWLRAQELCSEDSSDLAGLDDSRGSGIQFSFGMDPNQDPSGGIGIVDTIKLSDYLFKQDKKDSDLFESLHENWKKYVGDIEYKLDVAAGGTPPTSGTPPPPKGVRKLTYKKIKAEKDFEQDVQKEIKIVYEKLLDHLKSYCEWVAGKTSPGANVDPRNHVPPNLNGGSSGVDNNSNYWKDHYEEMATIFSVQGYDFTPVHLDSFLSLFVESRGLNKEAKACDLLNKDNSNLVKYSNVVKPEEVASVDPAAKAYLFYAQRVAFARKFSLFVITEQYLDKATIGAFDVTAKKAANELIYAAAGVNNTNEMRAMYKRNIEALSDFMEPVLQKMHATSGRSFSKLQAVSRVDSSSASANPQQGGSVGQ